MTVLVLTSSLTAHLPFVCLVPSYALSLFLILLTHGSLSLSYTKTIRAVQPDVVVVELCQYRVSMLKMDENTLLREAKDINLDKVQQAIKQVWISE